MPKVIVAIGGGEIRTRGTAPIDREMIRLAKKKHPMFLFIPTASSDSDRYWKHIQEYFGEFLKCRTDVLFLIKEQLSREQIRRKISSADIIYVGRGNTLLMMRIWRRLGVDHLLKAAYENGTVLAGISAGSICRFGSGHWRHNVLLQPAKMEVHKCERFGASQGHPLPALQQHDAGYP